MSATDKVQEMHKKAFDKNHCMDDEIIHKASAEITLKLMEGLANYMNESGVEYNEREFIVFFYDKPVSASDLISKFMDTVDFNK